MRALLAQLGAVCEACSNWNAPGTAACTSCGGALPVAALLRPQEAATPVPAAATESCRRCGGRHPAGLSFCPGCGARLEAAPPPVGGLQPGGLRLLLLRGLGASGKPWPLAGAATVLGREHFPADDTVPARAATLLLRHGRLFVRDEGAGCVFVRLRHPELLPPGGLFAVGDQLLRFAGPVAPSRAQGPVPLLGSPVPAAAALLRLERVHLGGAPGAAWIRPAPVQLGRATGQILFPDDPFVSGRHCELEAAPEGALLRDLGSSNGTFVQVPPAAERELALGDTLRIGRNILRVESAFP